MSTPDYIYADPGLPDGGSGHADFCSKCGCATRIEAWEDGYDSGSGRPSQRYRTVCPARRHWWDGHHRSVRLFALETSR